MIKENKFKNAIAYFRYHFLQSGKFTLFISVVAAIITFINAINGQPVYRYTNAGEYVISYYEPTLGFSTFVLVFLCYLVPVLQFSFFKKRRNLDYIYSMPIHRGGLGAVHYVVGLLGVYIPFSVSYFTNFFVFASWPSDETKLLPLIEFYFWCLFFAWIFYSIFSFAFNEANNVTDGCVFMIFWSFVFTLGCGALDIYRYSGLLLPFGFIVEIQADYSDFATGAPIIDILRPNPDTSYLPVILFLTIVAIAAMLYLLITFGKRRTEKAEEISDSPFGYISMIPLYIILTMFTSMDVTIFIVLTIATIVGYTIFRRGIKYKVFDYTVMGIMLALCVIAIIQG